MTRPVWLEQLAIDLEAAAEAFTTETDHSERLFALMRSIGAVVEALGNELGMRAHMLPLIAVIEALDHVVQGYRDPLLSPPRKGGRPQRSGTRIVEQVAGVFAAKYLRSGGLTAAAADRAAARLLAAEGVLGKGGSLVTERTITDWRLAAYQSTSSPIVRNQVALIFKPPHPMATPQYILAEATEVVSQILATRARRITG